MSFRDALHSTAPWWREAMRRREADAEAEWRQARLGELVQAVRQAREEPRMKGGSWLYDLAKALGELRHGNGVPK